MPHHFPLLPVLAALLTILSPACPRAGAAEGQTIRWKAPYVRIPTDSYSPRCGPLEFSPDGKRVCAGWFPDPPLGDLNKMPWKTAVFDAAGPRIPSATNAGGYLGDGYLADFPGFALRQRFPGFNKDTADSRCPVWGFSGDHAIGLRILASRRNTLAPGTAELWRMDGSTSPVWKVRLPGLAPIRGLVRFYESGGKNLILVACGPQEAFVLSQDDGSLVDRIVYDPSASGDFAPFEFAFDPGRKLLAFGDSSSRRVRVVSMLQPHAAALDLHRRELSHVPIVGGGWATTGVSFQAGSRYLVVGYSFSGRMTTDGPEPTEFIDTRTWKVVLTLSDPESSSAVQPQLSPDGRLLAVSRDGSIEIGAFADLLR